MINGDNEGLMVQENVRIPTMVSRFLHCLVNTFLHGMVSRLCHLLNTNAYKECARDKLNDRTATCFW